MRKTDIRIAERSHTCRRQLIVRIERKTTLRLFMCVCYVERSSRGLVFKFWWDVRLGIYRSLGCSVHIEAEQEWVMASRPLYSLGVLRRRNKMDW